MGNKKVTLSRTFEVISAVNLVKDSRVVKGTPAFRLGTIAADCQKHAENYEKNVTKMRKKLSDDVLAAEIELGKENISYRKRINELNSAFNEEIGQLMSEEVEISAPELKLSMFVADKDCVETLILTEGENKQKKEDITIKQGDLIVPLNFIRLMGDLITE